MSFIETSALDASNVDVAFENVLSGKYFHQSFIRTKLFSYNSILIKMFSKF